MLDAKAFFDSCLSMIQLQRISCHNLSPPQSSPHSNLALHRMTGIMRLKTGGSSKRTDLFYKTTTILLERHVYFKLTLPENQCSILEMLKNMQDYMCVSTLAFEHETLGGCTAQTNLVGGFDPFEKYQSNWESSPTRGENKNIFELPPPRNGCLSRFWKRIILGSRVSKPRVFRDPSQQTPTQQLSSS